VNVTVDIVTYQYVDNTDNDHNISFAHINKPSNGDLATLEETKADFAAL